MSSVSYSLAYPFDDVKEALIDMKEVDGVSGGVSPATVRWLTNKNKYINVGLEEVSTDTSRVIKNNNSYEVKDEEVKEAFDAINEFMAKVVK